MILKRYTILEDFFLLDSVRYHNDVMTTLKFDWSNLKILMSGWYRKLTSSCVSFTIYQQCHTNVEGDVTPISLQYQNVYWDWRKHDKNNSQISELLLFGLSSNNDASNTCILNATIQYILATKRFDVPLTKSWVIWNIHIFEYIC